MSPIPGWVTVAQAAKDKNTTRQAVLRWIDLGLLPNARQIDDTPGSPWLIPAADLTGFVPPRRGKPAKAGKEKDAE